MAIVLIHLSNEQELDGKMLKYTAATGPVYLRALEELAMLKEEVFLFSMVCLERKKMALKPSLNLILFFFNV